MQELHYLALYELGIFLMYDELKALAQKGLLRYLSSHWHSLEVVMHRWPDIDQIHLDQVIRVLKETYTRIPAEEGSLRLEVAAACIEGRAAINDFGEVCRLQEIWDVIGRHELSTWQLGLRLKLGHGERNTQALHDKILREARYQRPGSYGQHEDANTSLRERLCVVEYLGCLKKSILPRSAPVRFRYPRSAAMLEDCRPVRLKRSVPLLCKRHCA